MKISFTLSGLKNTKGVSLLLGMGFSVALLSAASLISTAMIHAQKNTRSIEDVNIAFFAAEAGIEEALYYNSFHGKGFTLDEAETSLGVGTIPNTFYDWNIEGQIDDIICADPDQEKKCIGSILFGKSATLNFSYDENTKNTTDSINENHNNTGNGTTIDFAISDTFTAANLENDNTKVISSWVASYLNTTTTTEDKLFFQHNGSEPLGGEAADCSDVNNPEGKLICLDALKNTEFDGNKTFTGSFNFTISSSIKGCEKLSCEDPASPPVLPTPVTTDLYGTFFQNIATQEWRKIKFFYIQSINGFDPNTDPSIDKIYYKLTPAVGTTMTALKTIISSQGRSKTIISDLEIKIDNTQELSALDYGILFE